MKIFKFQHTNKMGWQNLPSPAEVDSDKTLILAFCAPQYKEQPEVIEKLKNTFPKSIILGCSTAGEIFGDRIFDLSISCVALCFKNSRLKLATQSLENASQSFKTGEDLAQKLMAPDLKGAIMLSDGLFVNGSALAEGFGSKIDPSKVSVFGGLAGDGSDFKSTWVLVNGEIQSQCVTAVGLYGDNLIISTATKGGWDIFGVERHITRSVDNIVYEIDDQPALDIYKEYLGDKAKDLPSSGLLFPLQIRTNSSDEKRLVRTILSIDEKEKSLTFAGTIPQGSLARLMRANFDRVIDGAAVAADEIKKHVISLAGEKALESPSVSLAVSCVGRRLILGARSEEEVEVVASGISKEATLIGFYSYGELAPSLQGSACDLHNQSMTLMNIYEVEKVK